MSWDKVQNKRGFNYEWRKVVDLHEYPISDWVITFLTHAPTI